MILPGDAGVNVLPFCVLHCLFSFFCAAVSRDASMKRPGEERGLSPKGNGQHGSASRMERAAALTGTPTGP